MKKILSKIISSLKLELRNVAFTYLSHYKEVVWLIGSGRSGTTWASNLINHDKGYRELFEPFHPKVIRYVKNPILHKYLRQSHTDPDLLKFASEVFSGKFIHQSVDKGNRTTLYRKLLVKDISVNLFSYSLSRHFPNVKIILLIRNPFAVALSKYKTKDWGWMSEANGFLKQPELVDDYLQPFKGLIQEVHDSGDYVQNQILIWCIINYVPLIQFKPNQLCTVFYEDLVINPGSELARIQYFLDPTTPAEAVTIREEIVNAPSKVTSKGKSQFLISAWQNELTKEQIDAGLRIMDYFGFKDLYHPDSTPNRAILTQLKSQSSD